MPLFECPMFNVWCGLIRTQPYLNATVFDHNHILNATIFECEHIWKISDFHFFGTYLRFAPTFFFSPTFLISFFSPTICLPTSPFFFLLPFFLPLLFTVLFLPFWISFFHPHFFNPHFFPFQFFFNPIFLLLPPFLYSPFFFCIPSVV